MKYKPYSSYKDSGVEWLGEIPEHWEVKKLKYISSINDDTLSDKVIDDFEINYIDISSVSTGKIDNYQTMSYSNSPSRARRIIKDGDILVSTVRTYLKAIAPVSPMYNNFIASTGFAVIRSGKNILSSFSKYALLSNYFVDLVESESVGISYPAINSSELINLNLVIPTIEEQNAIADYLDKSTAKIDTLITKQQKLIELLKEKRQAVISHAVTKGLNPDVPMKDSGVEWLGEVPEHWEIGFLSTLFENNKKKNIGMKNNNLLSLSYGRIIKKNIDTAFGLLPESFETYQIVYEWYIVLRLTDLQNDKKSLRTGLVTQEGIITSAYVALKKKSKSIGNEKYFHYYLHTFDIYKGFYGMGSGVRQSLNFDELKKLKFILPPIHEQNDIVKFIDMKTSQIDTLVSKSTKSIELLKEKRTALISAAVTGKIDVRDLA